MANLSIWNGRRRADIDRLAALLPNFGSATFTPDNFELEVFRLIGNAYYDLYNNGGGNWKLYTKTFQFACRRHEIKGLNLRDMWKEIDYKGYCNKLEHLYDLAINAALKEQFGVTEFNDQFL